MTLYVALLRMWFRDAIGDRFRWFIEDLRSDNTTAWDNESTGEWLAPARYKIGSSR